MWIDTYICQETRPSLVQIKILIPTHTVNQCWLSIESLWRNISQSQLPHVSILFICISHQSHFKDYVRKETLYFKLAGHSEDKINSYRHLISFLAPWHTANHMEELLNFHSVAAGGCDNNFQSMIFKLIIQNSSWIPCREIVLKWMPQNFTDVNSTMVQVMAWCRQATSHYPSQCWSRSLSPFDINKPQLVNSLAPGWCGSSFKTAIVQHMLYSRALLVECNRTPLTTSQHWIR